MKRVYKWKVPQSFWSNDKKDIFLNWIDGFYLQLCYEFGKELKDRCEFENHYDLLQDDWDYLVMFRQDETSYMIDFQYDHEEEKNLVFDVEIEVINLKRFWIFHRRYEPSKQAFNKFHSAVLEIAEAHQIKVREK